MRSRTDSSAPASQGWLAGLANGIELALRIIETCRTRPCAALAEATEETVPQKSHGKNIGVKDRHSKVAKGNKTQRASMRNRP